MSTAAAKTKPAAKKKAPAKSRATKPKKPGGGKAISKRKTKTAPAEPQPEPPQPRRGRQTPTASVVLPYTDTKGQEAADLYAATGRTAQEWQLLLLCDIMAVGEDGLWVHTKCGYSVPRRNGKNEVVGMRELYGLENGEHMTRRRTWPRTGIPVRGMTLWDGRLRRMAPPRSWIRRMRVTFPPPTATPWLCMQCGNGSRRK